MGIREEILALGEWAQDKSWGHIYLQGLVDAANLVDKHLGERLEERPIRREHFARDVLFDLYRLVSPGDRIAIYRLPEEEDGD